MRTHTHTHTHTGITVAMSSTGWWGGTIIVSQLFPILLSSVSSYGNLYIITGIGVLLTVYVLFLVPETKVSSEIYSDLSETLKRSIK